MLEDKETVTMTNCESVTLYFLWAFSLVRRPLSHLGLFLLQSHSKFNYQFNIVNS